MSGARADEDDRPAPGDPHTWLGVVALVACAALWSLNGPLIKLLSAGDSGLDGLAIACYRSLLGGLIFLPLARRRFHTLRCVRPVWPAASLATFTAMTACFVIATTMTAAANAIVLQYISPVCVFLLAPLLLHERPRWSEGLVLLVSMLGVAIIFAGSAAGADRTGLTVALASGLGYGTLTVILRGLRRVHPNVVVTWNTLGSGLLLLPAVALWSDFAVTPLQAGLLVLMSLVQFATPYALFSWALRHVEAHRASLIVLLETVLNPLWTWLIVGEPVPRATLIGGPFVLAGVVGWVLRTWQVERKRSAPVTPQPAATPLPPA